MADADEQEHRIQYGKFSSERRNRKIYHQQCGPDPRIRFRQTGMNICLLTADSIRNGYDELKSCNL